MTAFIGRREFITLLGGAAARRRRGRLLRAQQATVPNVGNRLDGGDLRREPLDTRRATLALLLKQAAPGLRLNERACCSGMKAPSDCEYRRFAGTRSPARSVRCYLAVVI